MTLNPEVATVVILFVAIVVFIWNRVSPAIVALGVTIALFATGVVDFVARYEGGQLAERSEFTRRGGRWFYTKEIP